MSEEIKLHKNEGIKLGSQQLRGTIAQELAACTPGQKPFGDESEQLIKFHGFYQQDDRDQRREKNPDGTPKAKEYSFMVRSRIPGGKVTARQMLAELDLCDRFGNGTLRITTRQGLQLHGVLCQNLKATIREINEIKLSTLAACGDVSRNVMCCPAPFHGDSVRRDMQAMADRLADHLKPRTTAYYEIWLSDENGEKTNVAEPFRPVEEPIYGATYLPRKFKAGVALPEDNCIDIYTQDLGLLAIVEHGKIVGYNVLVGGGMGVTPSAKKTFPALAKPMAFVSPEQVLAVAENVVKVQRDFGNRADRKLARLKYLIANWGIEKFKAKVEEYYGQSLAAPRPVEVTDVDDHIGWHEQGDGKLFLGINVENGRIKDEGTLRIKSGLRAIFSKYGMEARLTPLQGIILCNISPQDRAGVDALLREYGIPAAEELTLVRRYSMACPAWPTCGLAVTESERALPGILDAMEAELRRQGLQGERISVHMTGCPNGCARPYTPDIGLVGKAAGERYTVFLGGNVQGTRLAYLFQDMVPKAEIVPALAPVFARFKAERQVGESFGDFCHRVGKASLAPAAVEASASEE
ncbi:MAG: NADPH-dependent assimilatory sulfite reductase hemoprotein subunit [Planctomycetes bacterium]|nr:NADPH-dependent assimilatory sulfite reductase hemoprotein subunit [Planctomycetota bacterium]